MLFFAISYEMPVTWIFQYSHVLLTSSVRLRFEERYLLTITPNRLAKVDGITCYVTYRLHEGAKRVGSRLKIMGPKFLKLNSNIALRYKHD